MFLAFGAIGPWFYLGFRKRRRRKAFGAALPDTLQLMAGSLSAGLSLAQSIDTIVNEGVEPIASEFRRVLVETRLGVSLETALSGVGERFESKDFEWVVMAINIQRRVGGNLAELLETVAGTMREREYMRRQVNALAAEGKLSAYVLGGLPPGFLVYLMITKGDYVGVMFTRPLGWLMLGGGAVILSVGAFWMSSDHQGGGLADDHAVHHGRAARVRGAGTRGLRDARARPRPRAWPGRSSSSRR